MNIKNLLFLPLLASAALLAGCAAAPAAEDTADDPAVTAAGANDIVPLSLDANTAAPGQAVWTSDEELTIRTPGTYELTGSLEGRLTVDADGPVELILAGVNLSGTKCLNILSDAPVTLTAAAGTENRLSDGAAEPEANAPAAIVSLAPLTIGGEGSIAVTAGAGGGVRCKNDLTVAGSALTVTTAGPGLKAKGVLTVSGGDITVTSAGDGLASEGGRLTGGDIVLSGGAVSIASENRGLDGDGSVTITGGSLAITSADDGVRGGTVAISGGDLIIAAGRDGIQAGSLLTVSGGALDLTAGGGGGDAISHPGESFGPWSQASTEDSGSAKGLKSDGDVTITGGLIALNTADDGIHCAGVCTIDNADITILSSDDAIHADDMLVVNSGAIRIDDCFEGLEAFAVEIRGGDVVIRAVNDGINANGSEMMFARPGSSGETAETESTSASGSSTTYFLMSGGTLDLAVTGTMSNMGDGIDSNGAVYITGGELVVSTFGSFMENGLDTGWGGPVVTGGMVIAGGSSTMAESFSSSSTQCCAVVSTSYMPDGTEVSILDENGSVLWSVTLADAFSCLQVSHPGMTEGHVYTLRYGDQSTALDFTSTTNISQTRGFGGPGGRPF